MSDDDPFDRLGDASDREGDPFDHLDPDGDGADGSGEESTSPDDGWFEGNTRTDTADAGDATDGPESGVFEGEPADANDPFAGPSGEEELLEEAENVFQEMDTEGVDPDTVWEQLGEAPPAADTEGKTCAEVSKHTYCEQCQYFSAPPEVSCSNPGTEILAFLDMETVRVVDCPVVAERRALENED